MNKHKRLKIREFFSLKIDKTPAVSKDGKKNVCENYDFDYLGKDPKTEKGPNEESQKNCHI